MIPDLCVSFSGRFRISFSCYSVTTTGLGVALCSCLVLGILWVLPFRSSFFFFFLVLTHFQIISLIISTPLFYFLFFWRFHLNDVWPLNWSPNFIFFLFSIFLTNKLYFVLDLPNFIFFLLKCLFLLPFPNSHKFVSIQ